MKFWRAWFHRTFWSGLIFFILGFSNVYFIPKLENWVQTQIIIESQTRSPLIVKPDLVRIKLFPPRFTAEGVNLIPQKELAPLMAPSKVKAIDIQVDWLRALVGQVRIKELNISGIELKLFLKSTPQKPDRIELKWPLPLQPILDLPIENIHFHDTSIWAKIESKNLSVHVSKAELSIEKTEKNIYVSIDSPETQLKWTQKQSPLNVQLQTRFLVDPKQIQVSALRIQSQKTFLIASGLISKTIDLKSRLQVHMPNISEWIDLFPEIQSIPKIAGTSRLEFSVSGPLENPKLVSTLKAQDIQYNQFNIGHINTDLNYENQTIAISKLQLVNQAGPAEITKLIWRLGRNQSEDSIQFEASTPQLQLYDLLNQLGLKNGPVHLKIKSSALCKGQILTSFQIQCDVQARGDELEVKIKENKNYLPILEINRSQLKGVVKTDHQAFKFFTEAEVGDSTSGSVHGEVDFKKGFKISFDIKKINFQDIQKLGPLLLEGTGSAQGSTTGDSHSAQFDIKTHLDHLSVDKFNLGQFETTMSYRSGVLYFKDMIGKLENTRYLGNLNLNFHENELKLHIQSPFVELADLRDVFSRHFSFPFDFSGTGSFHLNAQGPFKLGALTYNLDSSFFRGLIADESYDEFQFKLHAINGNVEADQISITKGKSLMTLEGKINPEGIINATVKGSNLRIEESENINLAGIDVAGQIDTSIQIIGQLPRPTFLGQGQLTRFSVGGKVSEDSQFQFKLLPDRFELKGSWLGQQIQNDLILPFTDEAPFLLSFNVKKWNFANFFSLFSDAHRQKDIQTSLAFNGRISSESGGYRNASGQFSVENLYVRRGSIEIHNTHLIPIRFNSGRMDPTAFPLQGEGGFLKTSINRFDLKEHQLDLNLNGRVDLSIFTLLTPFLNELQGKLNVNLGLNGPLSRPNISGSAFVDQGIIKIKDFPHAFTKVRADILFSDQDLNINSIKADLGGGTIIGDGRVSWGQKIGFLDVFVKGSSQDVQLNVPEGFKSRGSGTWALSGIQFPYLLEVKHALTNTEVTAEFQDGNSNLNKTITPSTLLPKFLTQINSEPLQLQADLSFLNPIRVKNSLLDAYARGHMRIDGPPHRPKLTGILTPTPGGKIFFRDAVFEIQNGFVEYQNENPENAKIYLDATTKVIEVVRDESNRSKENTYEISLLVQGKLKPQPKITMTSLPSLSEREIISLLALGMTSSQLDQNKAGLAVANNSAQYTAALLQKPLSKEVRQRLGLDLQFSQTSASAESSSTTQFTISKQISPKWAASGSRTFEKNPTNSAKIEYKFKKDLSVIGSWEGKDGVNEVDRTTKSQDSILGIDLEFKVNFK